MAAPSKSWIAKRWKLKSKVEGLAADLLTRLSFQ
jgi:hypothetical protein